MLKLKKANGSPKAFARGARQCEQLLTDFAREVRRRSFAQERGDSQGLSRQYRRLDLFEIREKAR